MNYLAISSWGVYPGAVTAQARAALASSWGLLDTLPEPSAGTAYGLMKIGLHTVLA